MLHVIIYNILYLHENTQNMSLHIKSAIVHTVPSI